MSNLSNKSYEEQLQIRSDWVDAVAKILCTMREGSSRGCIVVKGRKIPVWHDYRERAIFAINQGLDYEI